MDSLEDKINDESKEIRLIIFTISDELGNRLRLGQSWFGMNYEQAKMIKIGDKIKPTEDPSLFCPEYREKAEYKVVYITDVPIK